MSQISDKIIKIPAIKVKLDALWRFWYRQESMQQSACKYDPTESDLKNKSHISEFSI